MFSNKIIVSCLLEQDSYMLLVIQETMINMGQVLGVLQRARQFKKIDGEAATWSNVNQLLARAGTCVGSMDELLAQIKGLLNTM